MESNTFHKWIIIKWYGSVGIEFEGRAGIQVEELSKLLEYETDFQKTSE